MDRTVATGNRLRRANIRPKWQALRVLATTPDDLLLFFHHVPYTYKLHSGKTVIQHIYDSHYEGAERRPPAWARVAALEGKIDQPLYEDMVRRLEYQAGHVIVWRDAIVQYFLKLSGIPDEMGRAGHYPGRLEAEDARLTGYKIIDVTPWEDASGGKAAVAPTQPKAQQEHPIDVSPVEAPACSAEWTYNGPPGRYDIAVQYFDLQPGIAHFTLAVNDRQIVSWSANDSLPSKRPDGDNSTRFTMRGVELKPGDRLRVDGVPDGSDPAALDYIEVDPAAAVLSASH
jgi:alpha-glucuronidase